MKMPKTVHLILAIVFLLSFIDSLFDTGTTHKLLLWEVNIWVYRLSRLAAAVLFMKFYLDLKNNEKQTLK